MKTHITRPPVCSESTTQRSPLVGYLAGAAGLSALLAAPQAEAAVTSVTFGFGSAFDYSDQDGIPSGASTLSPLGGALVALNQAGAISANSLALGARPTYGWGSVYMTASSSTYRGLPTFFANGTVIGAGGNGTPGFAYFDSPNAVLDFTTNQLNKDIGFITNSGNYGWANVSWDATAKSLTVNGAFVESTPGVAIAINDSLISAAPEPSRALLALAGLAAVGLRRRRKQVA